MQEHLSIRGGTRLSGSVAVSGAKNAALPLLVASLLSEGTCRISNVPELEDIAVTLRLLRASGAEATWRGDEVCVDASKLRQGTAPYALVKSLRASFWVLGPLLARTGEARVSLPGGDAIGTRPVDLHLRGLEQFGANIRIEHGLVIARTTAPLRPAEIQLGYPSVGATHHLMMTAALIDGTSVLLGAAREPEVVQLAEFLSEMGAGIDGAGTERVTIRGRRQLGGATCRVLGDRIEAATLLLSAAITGGDVEVCDISPSFLQSSLEILRQMGCEIEETTDSIKLRAPGRLSAVTVETAPFPGFATDVQPLFLAALTIAEGCSSVTETVFDNRFGHVAEYRRFGAEISIEGSTATIIGVPQLSGAPVESLDIRAAAGLVLMGLAASGTTSVHELHHLDRGYHDLVGKLTVLGADIRRVPSSPYQEIVLGC